MFPLLAPSEHQMRLVFRLALGVCLLVITYLALAPADQAPGLPSDKLNHILAFAVLAWLADKAYPGGYRAPYRWLLLLGYGLLIEVVQGLIPYREQSLLDFAADALGILLYNVVAMMRARREFGGS